MRGFVLQDWITIRGATTGITQVTQDEASWLSMEMYQDAIFQLQVTELTLGGGALVINMETAPIKDETLWLPMGPGPTPMGLNLTSANVGASNVLRVVLSSIGAAGNPLMRWIRWRLIPTGPFTAPWDLTFRILMSANQLFTTAIGGGGSGGAGGGGSK
jgi:hypothetical protein